MADFDVTLRLTVEVNDSVKNVNNAEEAVDELVGRVEDKVDGEVTDFVILDVAESSDDDSDVRNYYTDDLGWIDLDD